MNDYLYSIETKEYLYEKQFGDVHVYAYKTDSFDIPGRVHIRGRVLLDGVAVGRHLIADIPEDGTSEYVAAKECCREALSDAREWRDKHFPR